MHNEIIIFIANTSEYQTAILLNLLCQFYRSVPAQGDLKCDYDDGLSSENTEAILAPTTIERCFGPHLKLYYTVKTAAHSEDIAAQLNAYADSHAQHIHDHLFGGDDPDLNDLLDDSYEQSSFRNGRLIPLSEVANTNVSTQPTGSGNTEIRQNSLFSFFGRESARQAAQPEQTNGLVSWVRNLFN